jgi:hypothetical protein
VTQTVDIARENQPALGAPLKRRRNGQRVRPICEGCASSQGRGILGQRPLPLAVPRLRDEWVTVLHMCA